MANQVRSDDITLPIGSEPSELLVGFVLLSFTTSLLGKSYILSGLTHLRCSANQPELKQMVQKKR